MFLAVRNKTSHENITIQSKTVLGKAEPTTFVFETITVEQLGKTSSLFVEQTNRIHAIDLSDTSSEFSSFAQNFLSSTEIFEEGLSENENTQKDRPTIAKSNSRSRLLFCPFFLGGRGEGPTTERSESVR